MDGFKNKTNLISILLLSGSLLIFVASPGRLLQPLFNNYSQIYFVKLLGENPAPNTLNESEKWLSLASSINPAKDQIRIAKMRLLLAKNNPEKVLESVDLNQIVRNESDPMEGLWIGHALLRNGRRDDAVAVWRNAGVSSNYLIGQAKESGDRLWLELAAGLRNSSHTYFQIGRAAEEWSLQESIEAYQQAIELNQGWGDPTEKFLSQYRMTIHLYSLRGQDYPTQEVKEALIESINQAKNDHPETLPQLYIRLGTLGREMKDYQLAEASFQELVRLSPDAQNFLNLGQVIALSRQDPQPALESFVQAIILSDYDPAVIDSIANFAHQQRQNLGTKWLEQLSDSLPKTIEIPTIQ